MMMIILSMQVMQTVMQTMMQVMQTMMQVMKTMIQDNHIMYIAIVSVGININKVHLCKVDNSQAKPK